MFSFALRLACAKMFSEAQTVFLFGITTKCCLVFICEHLNKSEIRGHVLSVIEKCN